MLRQTEARFDQALQMDPNHSLAVHDFVHDYSRLLWQLGKLDAAESLFTSARRNAGEGAFPWDHFSQMPSEEVNPALRTKRAQSTFAPEEHDVGRFLQQHRDALAGDLSALIHNTSFSWADHFRSLEGHGARSSNASSRTSGWTELVLYQSDASGRQGQWNACHLLPVTCRLLRSAKLADLEGLPTEHTSSSQHTARFCCRVEVLRLQPGTHILYHTAPTNQRLKAHLGLLVPPAGSSALVVAGEKHLWTPGKVLLFDDSYFHEAYNNHASQDRWILSIDFWKPQLRPKLINALHPG